MSDITEVKPTERQLPDSHEQLSLALDAVGGGVFDWRILTKEWIRSDSWYELTGFKRGELEKWEAEHGSIIHPDDSNGLDDAFLAVANEECERFHYEFRIRHKSGEWRWLLGRGVIVERAPDGSPLRMVGTDTDITERKNAEEALRESEQRYRRLIEDQTELICRWLPDGTLTFVNNAYCQYFQKKEEELVGHSFMLQIPKEDRPAVKTHFASLDATNPVATHEHRVITADGSIRWQQWTNRVIFDQSGDIAEYQSIGRDVTDRKLAEEALHRAHGEFEKRVKTHTAELTEANDRLQSEIRERERASEKLYESEKRRQLLLESAFEGIVISEKGMILEANQAFADMFGYSLEALSGVSHTELTTPESAQKITKHNETGYKKTYEAVGLKRDGTQFDIELVGKNCTYNGRDVRITAIRDITMRKLAEVELEKREQYFRLFSMSSGDCFWNWDMLDGTVERSSGFERAFGYSEKEILPCIEWWADRIHLDDKEKVWGVFDAAVARSQSTCDYEYRFRCRDGSYAIVDDHVYLIRDATGKVVRSLGTMHDITERKKIEVALRDSEERFRVVFEAAPSGMVIADADGNAIRYNKVMQNMLGYSEEEMRSMDISQYTHADDVAEGKQLFDELREGKRDNYEVEKRYIRKDGQILWGNLAFSSVRNDLGEIQYLIASVMDITERKRAEDRATRFSRVLEHSLNEIYIFDAETLCFINVNRGAMENLGYTIEELRSLTPLDIKPEFTAESFVELIEPLLGRVKEKIQFTSIHRRKDGTEYPVEVHLQLTDDDAPVFVAIILDITERKIAEKALRRLNQQLHASIDQMPVAYILWDNQFRVVEWNASAQQLFGYSKSEMVGKYAVNYIVPEQARFLVQEVVQKLQAGETASYSEEGNNIHKDGSVISCLWYNTPLKDETGTTVAILSMVTDDTERKHAEQRQLRLTRELDHRVKNTLASVLALAQQSIAQSHSLSDFSDTFSGRIHALARTHEALAAKKWSSVDFNDLIRMTLPDTGRITVKGAPLQMPAEYASPLCMTLHELATNARKYGALSTPDGVLEIGWTIDEQERVNFHWRESQGPPIDTSPKPGYGISLIHGFVEHELHGDAMLNFEHTGLECMLVFPMAVGETQSLESSETL